MVIVIVLSDFLLSMYSSRRRKAFNASPRQEVVLPERVPQQPQQTPLVKIESNRDDRDDIVTSYPGEKCTRTCNSPYFMLIVAVANLLYSMSQAH